jgi:hypothetical protein
MANLPAGNLSEVNQDSGTSDYGPEFTLDEEELLNGLLLNIATEPRLAGACAGDDKMLNPIQEYRVLGRTLQFISHGPKFKDEIEVPIEGGSRMPTQKGTYLFSSIDHEAL